MKLHPLSLTQASFYMALCLLSVLLSPYSEASDSIKTCDKVVLSGPPNLPPVVWTDYKTMKGAATDLLTQTLAEHNIATSTEHLGGYRRVLRAMEEGRIAMTVGITRDKFPEGVASFSDTPLYNHALTILVKRDMVEKPQEIRDLLELKGAMPDQLAVEDIFGAHSPKHLMRTFTPNLALKMLAIGRVDYTIYPDMQDDLFVSLMNMEGQFEKLPLLSATIPVYVAFSNQLDCALPLDKINQTLTQAAASKQAQQTLNDSLYKWMNYQLEKRD